VWYNLSGFTELANYFQYFKPLSYQLQVNVPVNSSFQGASCFFPINYIVEAAPTPSGLAEADLRTVRGAVSVMPGARNIGKWCKWPQGQQNMALIDASTHVAGVLLANTLLGFAGGLGVELTININVRAFRRMPYGQDALNTSFIPRELKDVPEEKDVVPSSEKPNSLTVLEKIHASVTKLVQALADLSLNRE
jgi:hypothetical protein